MRVTMIRPITHEFVISDSGERIRQEAQSRDLHMIQRAFGRQKEDNRDSVFSGG